jgi:predicted nucleic acid-binding protein
VQLLDTWAWVAYFGNEPEAPQVEERLQAGEVATSLLTIAELSDIYHREGLGSLEERLAFIASRGPLLDPDAAILLAAGEVKWAQRGRGAAMGLVDAAIYATARAHGLTVLTGDEGFQGLEGVEFLQPADRKRPPGPARAKRRR